MSNADTPASEAPKGLFSNLSLMMFLQYAIWGAWLPLFFSYLTGHLGLKGEEAGNLFAIGALGALIAPFLSGQLADRLMSSEKLLGISHLIGAVLVFMIGRVESYSALLLLAFFYSLVYAPTLSLTNSIAFHHLPDRDRDFGRVRVWGTVGWIAAGIGMGQWLLHQHSLDTTATDIMIAAARNAGKADAFTLSAILGAVLGVFCFFLPHTPPIEGKDKFAAREALARVKLQPLLTLFLIAFPVACIHQFYFVRTEGFLSSLQMDTPAIDAIFGVGGGPMTIGQIAEIAVLALMPWFFRSWSRKSILALGLLAYVLRFGAFAYLPYAWAVYPALALHGLCFGCFFFVCFMIVDEETSSDVRASAQSLFNLIIIGFGTIVGNIAAGYVDTIAAKEDGTTDFALLFGIPTWVALACLISLIAFYPKGAHRSDNDA